MSRATMFIVFIMLAMARLVVGETAFLSTLPTPRNLATDNVGKNVYIKNPPPTSVVARVVQKAKRKANGGQPFAGTN